jgi:hypothetical protein
MWDMELLIGTTFILLLAMIVGGTVLLYPLSRRLGELIDANVQHRRRTSAPADDRIEQMDARLAALEASLRTIEQRQEFVDRLLAERPGTDAPPQR